MWVAKTHCEFPHCRMKKSLRFIHFENTTEPGPKYGNFETTFFFKKRLNYLTLFHKVKGQLKQGDHLTTFLCGTVIYIQEHFQQWSTVSTAVC